MGVSVRKRTAPVSLILRVVQRCCRPRCRPPPLLVVATRGLDAAQHQLGGSRRMDRSTWPGAAGVPARIYIYVQTYACRGYAANTVRRDVRENTQDAGNAGYAQGYSANIAIRARGGLIIPYRNLPCAVPPMGTRGARASKAGALDERRFTPPNIEARRRSYTRGSEVGDRCRPSLKP